MNPNPGQVLDPACAKIDPTVALETLKQSISSKQKEIQTATNKTNIKEQINNMKRTQTALEQALKEARKEINTTNNIGERLASPKKTGNRYDSVTRSLKQKKSASPRRNHNTELTEIDEKILAELDEIMLREKQEKE